MRENVLGEGEQQCSRHICRVKGSCVCSVTGLGRSGEQDADPALTPCCARQVLGYRDASPRTPLQG